MDGAAVVDNLMGKGTVENSHSNSWFRLLAKMIDLELRKEREACAEIAQEYICGCGDHATEVARCIRERR